MEQKSHGFDWLTKQLDALTFGVQRIRIISLAMFHLAHMQNFKQTLLALVPLLNTFLRTCIATLITTVRQVRWGL